MQAAVARDRIPFRAVNRRDTPGYSPDMQRHHILPRQLLGEHCFGRLFDVIGRERVGFDDFRANGLLLPARDSAAVRFGLPLHRGPHRSYNQLVAERVGQVERGWAMLRTRAPEVAQDQALMRLGLLQRALRKRLLSPTRRLRLNKGDPLGTGLDFSDLDALAGLLWAGTQEAVFPDL